jgi:hypothetical protein
MSGERYLFFDGPARKGANFRFAGQRSDPVIQALGLVFTVCDEQLLDLLTNI